MCPTADGFEFGISAVQWDSAYYGAMAAVSSAAETVQKKATGISIPLQLWRFSRKLRDLADLVENPHEAKPVPASEKVDVPKALEQFDIMIAAVDKLYEQCCRAGYTNRTLTAASLHSIRNHTEIIRDFFERVKLIIDPATENMFEEARQEYLRGESVGLEAIR